MKKLSKILASLLLVSMIICSLVSCDIAGLLGGGNGDGDGTPEHIDYVANLTLDHNSSSLKTEVTVKSYIDGDTTHFYVPKTVSENGVLKARYLAVDTPESTGKIEEWGKKASNFTKNALKTAVSIIIESDDDKWNLDSTGDRHLVWVWYKSSENAEYRNLNLELLQNGLARASKSAQNRYGDTCVAAIAQAKAEVLHVHSKEKDPDMYYGDAVELTLKELRTNIADYVGIKVAFSGIITQNSNNGIYIESYDEETDMYYGVYVYYGFSFTGDTALKIIEVGNESRIVGTVQYYETGGSYQVADISYRQMKPDDPSNVQLISKGHTPSYKEADANTLINGEKTITLNVKNEDGEESTAEKTFKYGDLALGTSASLKGLTIKNVYTTDNDGNSDGAMTITCEASDGTVVKLRTIVLYDENNNRITAESFPVGSVIDAKGVVDVFSGEYQLKIFKMDSITFVNQ